MALSNTSSWENAGLADAFRTSARWERFEFLFRAKFDLPAATSRLQFWFKSTGTLWLDKATGAGSVEVIVDLTSVDFGHDKLNAWATSAEPTRLFAIVSVRIDESGNIKSWSMRTRASGRPSWRRSAQNV